jgi:hypothetical protein
MHERRCPAPGPLLPVRHYSSPLNLLRQKQARFLHELHGRKLLCLGPKLPERPVRNTVYGGRRQLWGEHLLLRSVLQRHLLFIGSNLSQWRML